MEDFLGWRAQKSKFSCLLPFPLALTTASAVLALTSGGKSTSSCCPPLFLPRAVSGAISALVSPNKWIQKLEQQFLCVLTYFSPTIPLSVLPKSHQKCKYSGMIHPQRWLKLNKKFYFSSARKKLGFKHLEWLTFIPSWKNWLNENKCASTKSIFLSSSACAFISLGCVCGRMVRKNIQKNAFWQRKRSQIRSMKFP